MKKKIAISLLIGGTLSIITLYFAFRNVPLNDLMSYLGDINYLWILPTSVIVIATFILRVLRWQIILHGSHSVKFWQAFHPLMIGFMINCVFPGRLGELARPTLLKKQRGVPLTTGLATVAAERIFDIIMLMVLFAFVSTIITSRPDLDIAYGSLHLNGNTLNTVAQGMLRLTIVLLFFIVMITISAVRRQLNRLIIGFSNLSGFLGSTFQQPVNRAAHMSTRLIDNFALGLRTVRRPRSLLACLALSILIWGLTALSYYIFALGCPGIHLSLVGWITVMVVICFFIALPSVPGFWGLWEAGGVFALSLFGVMEKEAAGFTLVNHAVQMFPVIIIGWVSALIASVNIWQLAYVSKEATA